jgi:hypothetical protein
VTQCGLRVPKDGGNQPRGETGHDGAVALMHSPNLFKVRKGNYFIEHMCVGLAGGEALDRAQRRGGSNPLGGEDKVRRHGSTRATRTPQRVLGRGSASLTQGGGGCAAVGVGSAKGGVHAFPCAREHAGVPVAWPQRRSDVSSQGCTLRRQV